MPLREHPICDDVHWIDVCDPTEKEMERLSLEFKLNAHIVKDCMEPMHLPKFDIVENINFLIIRFYILQRGKKIATIQDLTK